MRFSLPVRILLVPIRFVAFLIWMVPAIFLYLMGEEPKADAMLFFITDWGNEE
jgi:hypothetical protein